MYRYLILIVLFLTICFSCSNDENVFSPSEGFVDSNVNFKLIDTITFKMSTFKIDSFATDLYNTILVGKYEDEFFGKVVCNGYVNFVPNNFSLDEEAVFDSIVVNLAYKSYYYNDTLNLKKIKIYELEERFKYRYGESNFYNTTNFETSNLIGEKSFYPKIGKDSLTVTLSNDFGENLFNRIRSGGINDIEELSLFLKGLKIVPDDSENSAILSFDVTSSYLRFYYSLPDEIEEAKFYDFVYSDLYTNRNHFTQVVCDRTGTILPTDFITQRNEINSQSLGNQTFIQAGEGIVTKIRFPNFKESIQNMNINGTIFKADLKIPIKNNSYNDNLYISDSLRVFIVNQNNDLISEMSYAKLINEDEEFNRRYYNVSVESFLKSSLTNNNYTNYGIILIPINYSSSVTRLVLNDNYNSSAKSKLYLTYLTYGN